MPDLSYKITTEAELAGAQAAADALDRQIGKAKALKQDYSELSKQRDVVNQSLRDNVAITDDSTKATDVAAESTFKLSERSREQYRLFAELNRLVPGLGENLRGLAVMGFNPLIGLAMLVGTGFYQAKKALDDWNKSLDESGAAAAKSDFTDGIQARITVLNALIEATQTYADKEAQLALNEQNIAGALDDQLRLLAAIEQARGQQTQAQKALAEAQVTKAEQAGKITPSQAIEQKAEIERQFNLKEYQDKIAAGNDRLAAQQTALATANFFQPVFDNLKKVADANAADAEGKFKAAEDQLKSLKSPAEIAAKLKPLTDALEAAAKELEKQKGIAADVAVGGSPETIEYQNSVVAAAQASLDAANNALALQKKVIFQATAATSPEARAQLKKIEDDAKEADKKATDNVEEISKLTRQVSALQAEMAATGPIAAGTITTKQATVSTKEETELEKQAKRDIEQYNKFLTSGISSPESLSEALAVLKDLHAALVGHVEVIAYVKTLGVTVQQLLDAQKTLESRLGHHQLQ
jgi:hypothetical protein